MSENLRSCHESFGILTDSPKFVLDPEHATSLARVPSGTCIQVCPSDGFGTSQITALIERLRAGGYLGMGHPVRVLYEGYLTACESHLLLAWVGSWASSSSYSARNSLAASTTSFSRVGKIK